MRLQLPAVVQAGNELMASDFCMCFSILHEIEADMDRRRGFCLTMYACSIASSGLFLLF